MNILHVSRIGKIKEGIGTVLCKLVPCQISYGNKVKIISTLKNEVYQDINIEYIHTEEKFQEVLEAFKPDVVVFHSVYSMSYVLFYRILLNNNIPYLIQMHGALSAQNYAKGKLKKWLANKLFFNRFLKKAKAIIYLNESERSNCIVNKINTNSIIIPNGCEKVKTLLEKKTPVFPLDILYIGRIDMVHKGNDKLIEAMRVLKKEGFDKCKISVYANPNDPDLPLFKNKIQDLTDYIEYKGGIYGYDKDRRLRKADLFILTSRYEGMPMGILEALSYGLPCIITPGTNMANSIIRMHAGWVSNFDSYQIAETIKRAVDEYIKDLDKFRDNALKLSYEFDWEIIAKKSVQSYISVLK